MDGFISGLIDVYIHIVVMGLLVFFSFLRDLAFAFSVFSMGPCLCLQCFFYGSLPLLAVFFPGDLVFACSV